MNELKRLIGKGESERLEFKETLSLKDEIGETVSAFANTGKGLIMVGISDSGEIRGVRIGKKTVEEIANYIKQHTDNPVYPTIRVERVNNKDVLVIEVIEHSEKPVFFKGKAFKRIGKSTHKLSASEIRQLAKKSTKAYWDEQICEKAAFKDIEQEAVKWFLGKAKTERNLDIDPETPLKEALERLELIREGKPTNASVLLFGKNFNRFFLQARIRCARFKGTEALDYIDMKVFDGTITELRESAMKFIMQHTKHAVYFDANRRYDRWEYPLRALEEVFTNALAHRDYNTTAEVQVSVFDDRIEVWNPGELPEPLTPEDLKKEHKSVPRNPLIAEMLFFIRYIEKWGKGTNRILEEMKKQKLQEPEFQNLSGGFEVVLPGPGVEFTKEIEKERYHVLELNPRQKKAIEYLKKKGFISSRIYQEINKLGKVYSVKELNDMIVKKIIKKTGRGKQVRYRLM